ncbi:MAG: SPFH/Band 7/PHB domain protein [Butyrivibrio sp.]|nr:SPFH/Band 7/PHB domain protein [Butyrivibrio sp.]
MPVIICIIILILVLIAANIKVVPQAHAYVLEELGAFKTVWGVGLHVKIPFIDTIARKVDLKEQYCDFPPQPVITQDNVTMQIDSIVFFKISDPQAYAYGVKNPIGAIENLTATTLRNVIGSLTLDETLTSRDEINAKMQDALDIATDPWGIKITRVELKNINPPEQIRDAMEKQMKAEREKREKILFAEGEKQSAITVAEGEKQSKILQAEADKQATILHAEAEKEKKIREAEGQAQAIKAVKNAEAEGIRMLKDAGADESVLTLKSLEAFEKAADGQATKIIVPSNLQGIAGLASSIKEVVNTK